MSDTRKDYPIVGGGSRPSPASSTSAQGGTRPTPRASGTVPPPAEPTMPGARHDAVTETFGVIGTDRNQGEGDRVSARRYNDAASRHAASGAVESAASAARASVEGSDAAVLEAAEAAGRRPAETSVIDRAMGLANRVRRVVGEIIEGRRGSR